MSVTSGKSEPDELQSGGAGRRRRWSAAEKVHMVRETLEPGVSVSLVARRHAIKPNQLFRWRKLYHEGSLASVAAGDPFVPATELASAERRIGELERLLGKKTLENEILKQAIKRSQERSGTERSTLISEDED